MKHLANRLAGAGPSCLWSSIKNDRSIACSIAAPARVGARGLPILTFRLPPYDVEADLSLVCETSGSVDVEIRRCLREGSL
jgi:hypothetical protein